MLKKSLLFYLILAFFSQSQLYSQTEPKVLVAIAHPDDDAVFAATVYKISFDLNGSVDYLLITNGEGGYKYSTLSERIYGLELTDEKIGRENLPRIRKKELEEGGSIVGVKNYYYLNQKDHKYTNDIDEVLDSVWNVTYVKNFISDLITKNKYDYIFILLPTYTTHAHHSSTGILVLEAVNNLDKDIRPVVLGGTVRNLNDTNYFYSGLKEFPLTSFTNDSLIFQLDRTQKFGYKDRLNYKIIVNWLIAEHKSQGTMQLLMNAGDLETFYFFDMNDKAKVEQVKKLFERLKENKFPKKEYDED